MTILYKIGRGLCHAWLSLFCHHKIYRQRLLYPKGAIFAANHASFLDPPIVGASWPKDVHFLAKRSLFKFKPFGWLIKQTHAHPIAGDSGDLSSIKAICQLLQKDFKVVIFPEGSRSVDGSLAEMKAGVVMIAQRVNCPIIPVYIHGTYEVWNRHRSFPKWSGHTACVFGTPIFIEAQDHENRRVVQERARHQLQEAILGLKKWYEEGAQGEPP